MRRHEADSTADADTRNVEFVDFFAVFADGDSPCGRVGTGSSAGSIAAYVRILLPPLRPEEGWGEGVRGAPA